VKAGQEIKIAVPIKGWPVPTTTWQNGDKDIVKDDRTKIEVGYRTRFRNIRLLKMVKDERVNLKGSNMPIVDVFGLRRPQQTIGTDENFFNLR
jgi:hypothetical protein